jgi:MFS transporter, SET family, sugar efflux transporter
MRNDRRMEFVALMTSRLTVILRNMARQPNLTGLLASTLSLGMAFSFFSPFISTWGTEHIGMSPTGFSVFMTLTSVCSIIMGTILGRLSDTRFSRKSILIVAAFGGALGYAGYGLLRNPCLLGIVGCTVMALSSGCFSQLFAHTREEYSHAAGVETGLIMSVVRVCFSFAWTVGPAVGSVILVAYGFRGLFSAAALLWILFLVGVFFFVPRHEHVKRVTKSPEDSIWKTFRRGDVAISFLAFALVSAAQSINMMNLPLAIIHELHGTERDFGIVFGIGPLVEIPMMLWFGHLASRGYMMRLIRLGFLLAILYFLGLTMAYAPWNVYLLQILSGAMVSILSNVALVFFQDLLPSQPGLATALFSNSQAAGNLMGVLSFGFLLEGFGHRGVFLSCAIVSIVGLFFIMRYKKLDTSFKTA